MDGVPERTTEIDATEVDWRVPQSLTQEGNRMKLLKAKTLLSMAVLLTTASTMLAEAPETQSAVDPALQPYERVQGLSGKITLIGSNTMSQVGATWGDGFRRLHPDVEVEIQVKGSANAVGSVIDGSASFGLLSRNINEAEVRAFHAKFGYVPTILTPVLEPQGIFVHKDNPVKSLSLAQLDAIFSTSLKRGEKKTAKTWGDLGVKGEWAKVPVVARGRGATTGSQVFFQSAILGGGDFRPDMASHDSNPDLISAIGKDHQSIGFAGSTFDNPEVKLVPVAWQTGETAVDVSNSAYPLVRRLQLVVNNNPKAKLNSLQMEFIKYVFSKSGQQDVVIGGFLPVPAGAAHVALEAIGGKTLN